MTLVCFAVPQEAKPFQKLANGKAGVRVLITGMGASNAERAVRSALNEHRPARVFSCGFAGALHPDLRIGDVVCARETPVLIARPVKFVCAERIAVTVAEKSALWARTGADAVEMESAVIARTCEGAGLGCVTLRAISDTAHEDLPLDFNLLVDAQQNLSATKLGFAILKTPWKIPALIQLEKNSSLAARNLAEVLMKII